MKKEGVILSLLFLLSLFVSYSTSFFFSKKKKKAAIAPTITKVASTTPVPKPIIKTGAGSNPRSHYLPEQCKRQEKDDKMGYPIFIPRLGAYHVNETKANHRFVSGMFEATHARPPHINSGAILFEADAKIGDVSGIVDLERVGRCEVTRDGKEALLSFHIARPKEGLHIRLAPWKKLVLRNFFVFFTPKTRRYFARVAQFPYNWESSIVSMFSDKNIARIDMSTFPLISILPDLKGFPAGQLIIKQATIRSRLAFSFVKPITAKDIIRVNNTILVPEPTVEKGKLRATYSGRMDLSSLGFMLPSLSGLNNVKTRAYSNEKRFKLKATLPGTISVLPRLVQLQDPVLFIVKKHVAFMPDQQAAEKPNSRVYIRGALQMLDTVAEAQVEFGQFYSVIKANVSFNSLVSGLMTARSAPAEANPSGKLDFHAKIDFNDRLLRYVSRKGEKELSRAARLNTGLILSNKFSRLIAKTDKAIHRTNENVLRLKRRLLNGESHRIYKLQHKITQKERLLQIMDKQITSLTNHINNVLKIDNTTVSHKIDVTKRMLTRLTREGHSISTSTFSFVDQHKLLAAEKKLERYQRRLETALNASSEVSQVSKKIADLTAQLDSLTAHPDGDIIKQIISLQQQYSTVERDFEKAKRAALRIAQLKDKIATLKEFSKSTKGELKLNLTTAFDDHYFTLLKLRQQYALYSARLNFVMYKLPPKLEQATHLVAQLKLRIADLKAAPATTPVDAISREARIAEINAELTKIEPLEKKMEKYLNDLARLRAEITKKNKKAAPLVEALNKMDRLHLKIAKLKDLQSYLTQKNANLQARANLVFRAAETFSPKLRAKNALQIKIHMSLLEKLLVDMKKVNHAALEKDKLKFQINLIKAQIAKATPRSKIALINKQANLQASLEAQSAIAWSEEAVRSAIKNVLGKLKLLGLNLPFRYAQLRDRINANAIRIDQINKLIAAVAKEDKHPKLIAASKLFKGTEKIAVDAILTNIHELNSMLLMKDRLQLEKAALSKEISHEYAFNPMSSNNIAQLQQELAKVQQFITNGKAMYSTMDNLMQAIHETRAAIMSLSPQVLATPSFSFQAEALRLEHIVQKLTPASQPANTLTFQLHDLKEKIEKLLSSTEHATQAQALAAELASEQFKLEGIQHLASRKGVYETRIKNLKHEIKNLVDLQKKQENQPATVSKIQKRMFTITKEIHRLVARLSVLKSQLHYRHPVHRKLNIILSERASLEKRIIRMKDKLELMIEAEENLPVPTGDITTVFHDKVSRRLMKAIRHYENRLNQLRTFREKLAHKGFSLDISTIKIFQVWRARTRVSLRELATTSKFRHVDVWLKVNDVPVRVNVFFNPHKPKRFARRVLRKAIQKVLKGAR